LEGIFYLRSFADADRLKAKAETAQNICIIGGGYIGLEAAAVLASAGKKVTLIEAAERLLARVTGPQLSQFFLNQHRAHGIDIRLNTPVERLMGRDGHIAAVEAGGSLVECDMLIAGIGLLPTAGALIAAGAKAGNGVIVDDLCRTSLANIYAIGDCACQATPFAGDALFRIESVQNAVDQAKTVAKDINGTPSPHCAVPWFWSNQYDLRLQTVGLSLGYDQTVLRGDPETGSFSVIYLKNSVVIALDCLNATKDYVQGRKLVETFATVAPEVLADTTIALKSLLPPA
jgi:3-phenylpropionate/trans-cinnamate dioxygenase ferredoxin reductase subunit